MTKDEMVQRLYCEMFYSEGHADALEFAIAGANEFFEHYKPAGIKCNPKVNTFVVKVAGEEYTITEQELIGSFRKDKPKKKREVLHVSESALEGMGEAILEGVKNSSCEPYIEWSRLRHALMNGKSVRLKK